MIEINNTKFNTRHVEYINRYKYEDQGKIVYKVKIQLVGRMFDEFTVDESKWIELGDITF